MNDFGNGFINPFVNFIPPGMGSPVYPGDYSGSVGFFHPGNLEYTPRPQPCAFFPGAMIPMQDAAVIALGLARPGYGPYTNVNNNVQLAQAMGEMYLPALPKIAS